MSELNEQVSAIVADAVEQILRLVGRDDIEVEDMDFDLPETIRPTPAGRPEPRRTGTRDPILDNFLGTNR